MKKFLISTAALCCLSLVTNASDLSDLITKFSEADTNGISIVKNSSESLKKINADVTTDASFTKLDLSFEGEEGDDYEGDAEDEANAFPVKPTVYVSQDKKTVYLLADQGTPGYPSYLKAQLKDFDGGTNAGITLYTNVSEDALSFRGSNDNEIHINFYTTGLILELLSVSTDDGDDVSKMKKIKKLFKSFAKLSKAA